MLPLLNDILTGAWWLFAASSSMLWNHVPTIFVLASAINRALPPLNAAADTISDYPSTFSSNVHHFCPCMYNGNNMLHVFHLRINSKQSWEWEWEKPIWDAQFKLKCRCSSPTGVRRLLLGKIARCQSNQYTSNTIRCIDEWAWVCVRVRVRVRVNGWIGMEKKALIERVWSDRCLSACT